MDLYGKDFIVSQEWSKDELLALLDLAARMKRDRFSPRWTSVLQHRTFFMFFYNPSVRTRQSFECAATELGGHAQFLEPGAMRLKTATTAGETVEDAARVMARYACGLGMRILEDKVPYYGAGNELLREYAYWADIPIINMADDKFHPCQGMADVMGWAEWYGEGPGRPNYDNLTGRNMIMMGVHTNMCILNRSFGIKQMTMWGIWCILVRDLTDSMYNPELFPHVSHEIGTELVIEYIEKYWCPTITSENLIASLT